MEFCHSFLFVMFVNQMNYETDREPDELIFIWFTVRFIVAPEKSEEGSVLLLHFDLY